MYCVTSIDDDKKNIIPLRPVICKDFDAWSATQSELAREWMLSLNFTAKPGTFCLLPNADGKVSAVLLGLASDKDFWSFGVLPRHLPEGVYQVEPALPLKQMEAIAMAWELGAYQFSHYKKAKTIKPRLLIDASIVDTVSHMSETILWVRDLINLPAEDLGPTELSIAAFKLGEAFGAKVSQIVGDSLLETNYPAVHAVGRASNDPPRLLDLRWQGGNDSSELPKIVLVGKGVCFDSGGLDIKNAAGMLDMRKDMGGAAHALGLARLIMAHNLPVQLRVLVPAVENAISGNAYRPGDILKTRAGLSVEVGNTDAEGRLILADALAEACSWEPELIIDFATLTGAARVALGPDLPAFFTSDETLSEALLQSSEAVNDPIWRLPLYAPYNKFIESKVADVCNSSSVRYGGAITAALFLEHFVSTTIPWVHFDIMASNTRDLPGRPEGGEAMGLRAVFHYLVQRFIPAAA